MSTLYPRVVAIHRLLEEASQTASQQVGLLGYQGAEQTTVATDPNGEQVLFTGIICTIQADQTGRTKNSMLPSDMTSKPTWLIIIPSSALAQYSVRDRDIVIDDEGYRYGVTSNWWTVLGYNLTTIRLEA